MEQLQSEIEELEDRFNKTFDLKLAIQIVNKKEELYLLLKNKNK